MAFLQFKFDQVTFQSRDIFNTYIYETDDTIADVLTTGYFDACRFAQSDDWVGSIIQCKCSDTYAEVYALANGATELVMPTAADVNQVVKFPQSPIQPQYNKITQGVVVCCFDGTDKKVVHMSDSVGAIESYNATNVATADASNQGGATIHGVTSSRVATSAVLGILTPRSISGGVSLFSAGSTAYDESIGRTSSSETSSPTPLRFAKPTFLSPTLATINFGDRNVYDLTTGKVVSFWVKNRAKISFWCGAAATYSATVRIDVNRTADGTSPTYDLTGKTGRYEIEIPDVGINGYVSISNATTDKCYVMGVNITPIQEADPLENYDAFTTWYYINYLAAPFHWVGPSNGSNSFALRASGVGRKTFGPWHGGFSNETVELNNGQELIAVSGAAPTSVAFTGGSITTATTSTLTIGSSAMTSLGIAVGEDVYLELNDDAAPVPTGLDIDTVFKVTSITADSFTVSAKIITGNLSDVQGQVTKYIAFEYGKSLTFKSVSDLTDGTILADCTQKVTFFQGGHRIESKVDFNGQYPMTNMYTCMTCANKRFTQVISPIIADISATAENDETQLGPVSECIQYDPTNNHYIETKGTWFSHGYVAREGMYILNRLSIGDNKAYVDSMKGSDKISSGFLAVTYHLFNS